MLEMQVIARETLGEKYFPLLLILMKNPTFPPNIHAICKVPLFSALCSLPTVSLKQEIKSIIMDL